LGIAMSITAFRFWHRSGKEIHKTKLGAIVITCAAADDITAWCLCSNRNSKSGDFISSLYVISLAAIYVLVMIFIVKPFLKRIGDLYGSKDSIGKPVLAIFFLLLILSSYATRKLVFMPFWCLYDGFYYADISKF
jgi:Kef-type K+ transport system membrane component KefB